MGFPAELRKQALLDIERRTYVGSQTYLPCWLGIAVATDVIRTQPAYTAVLAGMFAITALARTILHRRFSALAAADVRLAAVLFRLLLLAGAAQFGVVAATSLLWPPLRPADQALILVGAVVCAAATVALSLDPWARFGLAIAMGGPVGVGVALDVTANHLIVGVLIPVYYLYLLATSRYVRDDYWDAARAGLLLRQRAVELERLSQTDPLTQIANRLAFDRRLEWEWARAARECRPLSILLADVDHFKRLNDTHGHPVGDRCLVAAAAALVANVYRSVDLVARYGGEEFIVMLPDTEVDAALVVAQRLRRAIAALLVDHNGTDVRFTCSVGVVTVSPHRQRGTPSRAVTVADQALYQAKASGRDRVVVWEDVPDPSGSTPAASAAS